MTDMEWSVHCIPSWTSGVAAVGGSSVHRIPIPDQSWVVGVVQQVEYRLRRRCRRPWGPRQHRGSDVDEVKQ